MDGRIPFSHRSDEGCRGKIRVNTNCFFEIQYYHRRWSVLLKSLVKREGSDSLLKIKVKTRQVSNKLVLSDNSVFVYVKDPPQKGKANKAILKVLRKFFKTEITLVSGHTGKEKIVRLHNLLPEQVQEIINVKRI